MINFPNSLLAFIGLLLAVNLASAQPESMSRNTAQRPAVGIQGTPSFVIGKTSANGLDGVRFVGAQPYAQFDAKLKELLPK